MCVYDPLLRNCGPVFFIVLLQFTEVSWFSFHNSIKVPLKPFNVVEVKTLTRTLQYYVVLLTLEFNNSHTGEFHSLQKEKGNKGYIRKIVHKKTKNTESINKIPLYYVQIVTMYSRIN